VSQAQAARTEPLHELEGGDLADLRGVSVMIGLYTYFSGHVMAGIVPRPSC